MVDWDRIEELRSKGTDWAKIAAVSKVGFRPEAAIRDPGRALRALYHRHRARERRQRPEPIAPKRSAIDTERRWTLARIGYLALPLLGVWFLLAYVAPSPVGLLVPAIPYLALGLAIAAFVLIFALWRTQDGKRWSKFFRTTVISGVILGLVLSGTIALVGTLVFGCPYLPPASSLTTQSASGMGTDPATIPPWTSGGMRPWQDGGLPTMYFYAASWCPFCSAGSWAIYKALAEFGNVTGASGALNYSDPQDYAPNTPEIVLSEVGYDSRWISFEVSEYSGPAAGHPFPPTSSCYQQAYFAAYGASSIPFLVINGQYVHGESQLIYPPSLSAYAGSGASTVMSQVLAESGSAWSAVQFQAWWVMAFLVRSTGVPVSKLGGALGWSSATMTAVTADVGEIQ